MGSGGLSRYNAVMKNDEAYNNRDFIPDADGFVTRWEAEAAAFRAREAGLGRARLNHAYGDHARMKLDLFHPAGRAEGLVVFVHGGYWRLFDRGYWSHLAQGALARGWAVAMPSYVLAPEARIAQITQMVARAVEEAAGLVAGPLALAGHSAGGHLVARMLCGAGLAPDVAARLVRAAAISPVSDLRPLLETSMNADLRLDPAEAAAESPRLLQRAHAAALDVWVGADERPVFLDQARWLSEAWAGSDLHVLPGRHHFDIVEPLADGESAMIRRLLAL